jgi:hypothetical protein
MLTRGHLFYVDTWIDGLTLGKVSQISTVVAEGDPPSWMVKPDEGTQTGHGLQLEDAHSSVGGSGCQQPVNGTQLSIRFAWFVLANLFFLAVNLGSCALCTIAP